MEIKQKIIFDSSIDQIDLFVFDTFEVLNGIFFNANNVATQFQVLEGVIHRIEQEVVPCFSIISGLQRYSNKQNEFGKYISAVYNEYYTNSSFKRNCRNQIFKNLHPKLVSLGILKNKDPLVEILAPFLLIELALYLSIFDNGAYSVVFGLEEEMEIIKAIKAGRYPSFNHYLNHPVEHSKVFLYQEKSE